MNTWSDAIMSSSLCLSNLKLARSRDKKKPWLMTTWHDNSKLGSRIPLKTIVCLGFNYKPKSNSSQKPSLHWHCNGWWHWRELNQHKTKWSKNVFALLLLYLIYNNGRKDFTTKIRKSSHLLNIRFVCARDAAMSMQWHYIYFSHLSSTFSNSSSWDGM